MILCKNTKFLQFYQNKTLLRQRYFAALSMTQQKMHIVKVETLHCFQNERENASDSKCLLLRQRLLATLRVTAQKCLVVKAEILH